MNEEQVGHAYFFFGPEGIGKRMSALAFAKALNCSDEAARARQDFCDTCRSCRMIDLGQHPDVRLLTPETTGGKTVIPLDAIRTKIGEKPSHPLPLREDAQLKPLEGRYKVYIIDPANRPGLQEEAGNALLLTLEDPPPFVVIILLSARPSAVLSTLVSRCRPVRFQLAPYKIVQEALTDTGLVSPLQASAIAGMAGGRIGWALSVAANPLALSMRQELFAEIDRLLPAGQPAALRMAEKMHQLATSAEIIPDVELEGKQASPDRIARRNLPELLDLAASWWRDMLVVEIGQSAMCINADYADVLAQHTGRMSPDEIQHGLHAVLHAKRVIEKNANIDLTLEQMWMSMLPSGAAIKHR